MDKKMRDLTEAMHAETDVKTHRRMAAVRGVRTGVTTSHVADMFDVSQRTIQLWTERFDKYGVDGLRDLPGRGKKSSIPYDRIEKLACRLERKSMLLPKKLRNWTYKRLGISYSMCSVRRIMRILGFSRKTSKVALAGAAGRRVVRAWQRGSVELISRLKRLGYAIAVQDGPVFVRGDAGSGTKKWSRIGEPVAIGQSNKRDRIVAYGALAGDGSRMVRLYDKFDGSTFVQYLKEAHRRWGKVLLIADNASQHRSKPVKKYLKKHRTVKILYLPVATPQLSAVEEFWRQAKYRLVTSEHYESLQELKKAVSEYFRTCSVRLDIYRYLERSI